MADRLKIVDRGTVYYTRGCDLQTVVATGGGEATVYLAVPPGVILLTEAADVRAIVEWIEWQLAPFGPANPDSEQQAYDRRAGKALQRLEQRRWLVRPETSGGWEVRTPLPFTAATALEALERAIDALKDDMSSG